MRQLSAIFLLFALMTLFSFCPALAQEDDHFSVTALIPQPCAGDEQSGDIELYFGPTQGSLYKAGLTINLAAPHVYFGQYDCWAMVAPGTPDAFGPVGWVEAAAAAFPEEPLLSFDDALSIKTSTVAHLTADPLAAAQAPLCVVPRGTQVLLLAQMGDWGYVQSYVGDTPVRAFLPLSSLY